MSKQVGKIHVALGLDATRFQKGLKRASTRMAAFSRRAGASMGLAAAGVATGLSLMTRSGLRFVDEQAKVARSIDGTINGLRALQIAGSDAGIANSTLNKSVQMMGGRLAEAARRGGPAADMLDEMGLSAKDLLKLDVDERIAVIADRAKELGFSAAQASDMLTQFGIRSKEMASLITQGGDAIRDARQEVRDFGLAISRDQAAAVERANDAMSRMKFVTEGLRVQLATKMAPTLEHIALRWQEMAKTGGPLQAATERLSASFSDLIEKLASPEFVNAAVKIGTGLVDALKLAVSGLQFLVKHSTEAKVAMVALGGAMLFFGGPILGAITAISGALLLLSGNTNAAAESAAAAQRAEDEFNTALGNVRANVPGAAAEAITLANARADLARSTLDSAEAELTALRARQAYTSQGQRGGQLLETQGRMIAAQIEDVNALRLRLKDAEYSVVAVASAVDGADLGNGLISEEIAEVPNVLQELNSELDELRRQIDPSITRLESYTQAMDLLKRGLETTAISQEEYNTRVDQVEALFGAVAESAGAAGVAIADAGEKADDFGVRVKGAVETAAGAFGDWVSRWFKDFNGFLKSAFSGFKRLILNMASAWAKAKIFKFLGFGGAGAAIGTPSVAGVLGGGAGGGGLLGGAGAALLGSFGTAAGGGAAGLLGGLGSTLGVGAATGAGTGLLGIGAGAAAAGGGIMATIGAAMPIIGIGLALFAIFKKKKPPISAKDFALIQSGLKLTGMEMLSTGQAGKKTAAALKKAAGGIKEFASQSQFYFDNFFTGSEKRAKALESLTQTFGELGIAMPTTAQAFRDIVESLDLTTKAGQSAYSGLLKVAPTFTSVFGAIADAGKALRASFGDDVYRTKEEMTRAIAAVNRGATISVRPSGSGVVNIRDYVSIAERTAAAQELAVSAGLAAADATARQFSLLSRWEKDGMPPVRT